MIEDIKLIKSEILKKIKPKTDYSKEINEIKKILEENLKKKEIYAEVFLGGSIAKGTNLEGDHDTDIFVRFDPIYKNEDISNLLTLLVPKEAKRIHGSRDYFQIKKDKMLFEVVPVLKIKDYKEAQNVTDVSPLHVTYFNKKTFNREFLKDEVRILKQFCKSARCYGAESYIRGFSGHVLDILILHYRSFENVLKSAAEWKGKVIIDIEKSLKEPLKELNKEKTESPLVIVDPVQPNRNAAAAISKESFLRFIDAAKAFLKNPSMGFFEITHIDYNLLKEKFKGKKIFRISIKPIEESKDIAGTKCLKVFEFIKNNLEKHEFKILFSDWEFDVDKATLFFVIEDEKLSKEIILKGPPILEESFIEDFKKKHKQTFVKDNRIYAIEKREYRVAKDLLKVLINSSYVMERVLDISMIC